MARTLRLVVPLLALLGVCMVAVSFAATRVGRTWFQRDVELRSELAVHSAQESLLQALSERNAVAVEHAVEELVQDPRVLGATVCGSLVHIEGMGARCEPYANLIAQAEANAHSAHEVWSENSYVSAVPIRGRGEAAVVLVVHDMRFVAERIREARLYTFGAMGFLALLASVFVVVATRQQRRAVTSEIRERLRRFAPSVPPAPNDEDDDDGSEFAPILRDVRELAAEIAADQAQAPGPWTPERLRELLRTQLHGERIVIVSNREPYLHVWRNELEGEERSMRVLHPASGLVTALEPIMRACSGVWVAHGSGNADRHAVDANDRVQVPPDAPAEGQYTLRRVWLSDEQEHGYYYGFSNEGLWPLCHIADTRPHFRSADFEQYRAVNQLFCDAICQEVDRADPVILVQDYHLGLLPAMLRERLPKATIITFWHIPWPNAERFGICPFGPELLHGLLGSTILGFHTQAYCNHFFDAVDDMLEARIDRADSSVTFRARRTRVHPYPISIAFPPAPVAHGSSQPKLIDSIEADEESVLEELGLPRHVLLGIGADRLDYTKGIEERLLAVERLFELHPAWIGTFTFVQLAAPSRSILPAYRDLERRVDELTLRINARFRAECNGVPPIVLQKANHSPARVFRFFRASALCYVSSLHDGMNLVAKEFVAARDDERGVLVLSKFTGAARELTEALIVNPYDFDEAASAMHLALSMSEVEQRDRMRSLRSTVRDRNIFRWAGRMLADAAVARRRRRLHDRLRDA